MKTVGSFKLIKVSGLNHRGLQLNLCQLTIIEHHPQSHKSKILEKLFSEVKRFSIICCCNEIL